MLATAAQAQLDGAAGADAEKSAKTIELLLQLQGSASAPGSSRVESGAYRQSGKSAEGLTAAERKPLMEPDENARAEMAEVDRRPEAARNDAVEAMARHQRTPDSIQRKSEVDAEASEMLPFQVFKYLRENREIAIGGAVILLLVAAAGGAAASFGSRKR